jgi:hypothetical protein
MAHDETGGQNAPNNKPDCRNITHIFDLSNSFVEFGVPKGLISGLQVQLNMLNRKCDALQVLKEVKQGSSQLHLPCHKLKFLPMGSISIFSLCVTAPQQAERLDTRKVE